jgi:hypothetical protein
MTCFGTAALSADTVSVHIIMVMECGNTGTKEINSDEPNASKIRFNST